MRLSEKRLYAVNVAIIISIVALIIMVIASIYGGINLSNSIKSQQRHSDNLVHIYSIQTLMEGIATGVQGYLLTGQQSYLKSYDNSSASVNNILSHLRSDLGNNSGQVKQLDILHSSINQELGVDKSLISIKSGNNLYFRKIQLF